MSILKVMESLPTYLVGGCPFLTLQTRQSLKLCLRPCQLFSTYITFDTDEMWQDCHYSIATWKVVGRTAFLGPASSKLYVQDPPCHSHCCKFSHSLGISMVRIKFYSKQLLCKTISQKDCSSVTTILICSWCIHYPLVLGVSIILCPLCIHYPSRISA